MPFELVNATMSGQDYIYEKAINSAMLLHYFTELMVKAMLVLIQDSLLTFKQGELGELDFVLDSGLPNITYDVNIDNINNPDVWLFL